MNETHERKTMKAFVVNIPREPQTSLQSESSSRIMPKLPANWRPGRQVFIASEGVDASLFEGSLLFNRQGTGCLIAAFAPSKWEIFAALEVELTGSEEVVHFIK